MWERTPPAGAIDWQTAVDYCNNLDFAGHTDWRLPTVGELSSIVAEGGFNPRVTPSIGLLPEEYWTSTAYPANPGQVRTVHFVGHGYANDPNSSINGVLPFPVRRVLAKTWTFPFAIAVRTP
jgi:hypothetical protein